MRSSFGLLTLALLATACGRTHLELPTFAGGGLLAGSTPLPAGSLAKLAANYTTGEGVERYGRKVSVKVTRSDLSIFGTNRFAIVQAGCLDGGTRLVLEGYWRSSQSEGIGLARLFVSPATVAAALCAGTDVAALPKPSLLGGDGTGKSEKLDLLLSLDYARDLVDVSSKFSIIAHHGSCRTIDQCGYSENSLESFRKVEAHGADKLEVDVRLTADGVPIVFHDIDFNERLVTGQFCHGSVTQLPFAALRSWCRLGYGEQIPTLDEALSVIVSETTIRGVWLDMKVADAVAPSAAAIARAQTLAASKGRTVEIFLGLPDNDVIAAYQQLPAGTPCLVEENAADVTRLACAHWGPRFTRGTMLTDVRALQKAGSSVYFWTVNDDVLVDFFQTVVHADAFITDRAGLTYQRAQENSASILAGPSP